MMRVIQKLGCVLRGAVATSCLVVAILLISGKARAQNYPVLTFVPGHVYMVQGASIRNGDYLVLEPSGLFFFGPIARPVALVARPMFGVGGSGVGLGVAVNVAPPSMRPEPGAPDTDFFIAPFISLEVHVERMYGPTSWRGTTYAGPQISLSLFVIKASLGWMTDVGDRADHHIQVAVGIGF
jgi:hypothetical protein